MAPWKQPPRAKVYEAFSAVADGRVHLGEPGRATVVSSGGDKAYAVEWSDDGRVITSNDNASYWQGYIGYPIIAVLLARGALHADEAAVAALAGIDWHTLNKRFKRDYDAAVRHVMAELGGRGADTAAIEQAVDGVVRQLASTPLERGPRRRPPAGES